MFDVNRFRRNMSAAGRNARITNDRELLDCYRYLQGKFDAATMSGNTAIIVDDYMLAKVQDKLDLLSDKFETDGIVINYEDYPCIEISPHPLYGRVSAPESTGVKVSNVKFLYVLVVIFIISTILSFFILDCIPFFDPFSHPIVYIITDLVIMGLVGTVYNKFK